jgi:hypothetical protein
MDDEEKMTPDQQELTPRERLVEWLLSDRGMGTVNLLFVAAILIGNPLLTVIAMAIWMAFLAVSIRRNGSRAMKTIYAALFVVAAVLALLNLWVLIFP